MRIPGLKRVAANYSDEEIMAAIDLAGAYLTLTRPHHRRDDFCSDLHLRNYNSHEMQHARNLQNPWAWVKPADIGPTSTRKTDLLERLKKMTEQGILEMRYHGYLPRFRVRRPHLHD